MERKWFPPTSPAATLKALVICRGWTQTSVSPGSDTLDHNARTDGFRPLLWKVLGILK